MVTLQGVIILRISDFRRFFDWNEFWAKKSEFLALFKNEEMYYRRFGKLFFVDDDKEYVLLSTLIKWIEEPTKEINLYRDDSKSKLTIKTSYGVYYEYLLNDKIRQCISEAKQIINPKTINGYTLLYLLLGAGEPNSDISIKYEKVNENKIFQNLYKDQQYQRGSLIPPFELKILANSSIENITINEVELRPQDCVVGVFHGETLCELLPNERNIAGLTFKLVKHPTRATTRLIIYGEPLSGFNFSNTTQTCINDSGEIIYRYIDDVVSFIANDNSMAVVDINGKLDITKGWLIVEDLSRDYDNVLAIKEQNAVITINGYF
ncbi:MAG: hypothetical protein IKJ31_08115 [Bacteroidaceae bacterium]|nr:hypothetical protein [Bacteroidaceae bacterium]